MKNRMARLLQLFLSFFCTSHIFTAYAQKLCSSFYFSRHVDKRLQCGIFETSPAVDYIECQRKCAKKMSCFSVNFYQNENGTDICELIKGTRNTFENPADCFVWRKGSDHYDLTYSDSCLSSSCQERQFRKALPRNWFQLGSSAFKLFKQTKTHTEAKAVCSANGGSLATINSKNENDFIAEMYLKEHLHLSKINALFIKDTLKPFRHWKLDGTDQNVILHGNLVAKKDEYNMSTILHFTGTAGSFATTPAWDINVMTFSISIWIKVEQIPSSMHFYSYWKSPYIFNMAATSGGISFQGRKKINQHSDMFVIKGGKVIANQWTHVVAVWNRATKQATLYQDGSQVAQSTLTTSELDFPAPTRPVFDLGLKRDSGSVMRGWLRELLIFDRAVTSEEVKTIRDATMLDQRTWIGAPQSYLNMAPVQQQNTNCMSARAWEQYQWEEVPCNRSMEFICKKTI